MAKVMMPKQMAPTGPKGPTGPNPKKGNAVAAPKTAGGGARNRIIKGAPYMADPNAIPGDSSGNTGIPFKKGGKVKGRR